MKKIFLFIILFGLATIQYSQVNIEKYNNVGEYKGFSGNLSFYVSAKTGNTDIQEFEADSKLGYTGDNFHTLIIGQGTFGWEDGNQYSNNALLHLRYIRELNSIVSPELFTQIDYDKKRSLLFRYLVGGGIRLALINDSLSSFSYGSSYMFEYEKLDLPKNSKHLHKTYNNRWNNYLSYSNLVSPNSRISLAVYFQPRFDQFNDFRILSENFISVNISSKLSLSLSFRFRYDSKPPDKIRKFDTISSMGITVSL